MKVSKLSPEVFDSSELDDWGVVELPLSEPACTLRGRYQVIPGREDTQAWIWECTPGRFRRKNPAGEMMHILSGECSFTPDDGQTIEGGPGDTFYFEPGTEGVWHIRSLLRKTFVLF